MKQLKRSPNSLMDNNSDVGHGVQSHITFTVDDYGNIGKSHTTFQYEPTGASVTVRKPGSPSQWRK